jgi:hypothetical protein
MERKRELPSYGMFCLTFLGFNFQRERDGEIFSKSEFYDLPYNDDVFHLVPYAPPEGWLCNEAERQHFEMVATIRKENNIPDLSEVANGKFIYWQGWVNKFRPNQDINKQLV